MPPSRHAVPSILALAWPMLVGQLAVMANGIIDNVMAGSLSAVALASITIGSSLYAVIYVCLLGTLQGLAPLLAHHFGAQQNADVGQTWRQGLWLGAALLLPGIGLLCAPEPLLALAQAEPAVASGAAQYLRMLALGLPFALWFRLFTILNTALSRPRTVMVINLLGPALKVPLNSLFMFGLPAGTLPGDLSVPALGVAGCGLASTVVYALSAAIGLIMLRCDRFYRPFALGGWGRPQPSALAGLLRLGLPIGATYLIDVTAFSLMTLLMGRLGTLTVSGHGIAANLAVVLYMIPVALGNATSVLAAQALGANQPARARRIARYGLMLAAVIALVAATALGLNRTQVISWYTSDPQVAAVAIPLIGVVAVYHVFDALQCSLAFVLRAWRITLAPLVIFALALWGIGLGTGTMLALHAGWGAAGFWWAATAALAVAAGALGWLFRRVTPSGTPTRRATTRPVLNPPE